MILNIIGFLLFSLAAINMAVAFLKPRSHGHEEVHIPSPGQVDAAIVNLDLHYTKRLCLELLLVDCTNHVTMGDEKVCGTDGVTYENHCKFTHAVCEYSTLTQTLRLANHGPCPQTTPIVTSGPEIWSKQTTHAVTSGPESLSQQTTSTVTSGSDSTHTTPHVTTDPLHSSFLCTYVNSMDCDSLGIEIICGSDGRRYVNQ